LPAQSRRTPVCGNDHEAAARHLADLLADAGLTSSGVEAWRFPEPQDKHIDRSDRGPLIPDPTPDGE